jgi:hypothetical protein
MKITLMEDLIMQALTAACVETVLYRWQFPVAVVQFGDTGEVQAVPQAHLTDISWSECGREWEIVEEFASANALAEFLSTGA